MTYKQKDQHILIGVSSFARGYNVKINPQFGQAGNQGAAPTFIDHCGTASYFVRVALFRDWIDEQLIGAKFCQNSGDADDQ